jgi:uncharacterized repeat protein (TIGR03943 family)
MSGFKPSSVMALLMAAVILRIAVSGEYLRYVQSQMRIPLLISGVLLATVALADLSGLLRRRTTVGHQHHDHQHHDVRGHSSDHHDEHNDHEHSPRVSLLLIAPVLALLVVVPPPLGLWGSQRSQNRPSPGLEWAKIETEPGKPAEMPLLDYVGRALAPGSETIKGVEVKLTGFVADDPKSPLTPGAFTISRFAIACCAADGLASTVKVVGADVPRSTETDLQWVEVVGTFEAMNGIVPTVRAKTTNLIDDPKDPYE